MAILLTGAAKLSNDVPRNPPPTWPSRQRPAKGDPCTTVIPARGGRRPRPQWPYSTCDVRPCASWISSA